MTFKLMKKAIILSHSFDANPFKVYNLIKKYGYDKAQSIMLHEKNKAIDAGAKKLYKSSLE